MARSAAIAATTRAELRNLLTEWSKRLAAQRSCLAARISASARSAAHRVLAKLTFHDARRYQALVEQLGYSMAGSWDRGPAVRSLRRLDPQGLGVWYLARSPAQTDLVSACRRSIALPRTGPPRAVGKLLEQALEGKAVRWFVQPEALDALASQVLLATALTSVVTAADLAAQRSRPDWARAHRCLTAAANAAQVTIGARRRAFGRLSGASATSVSLAYQAANSVRRALNHTTLISHDERSALEAATIALSSAHTACAAVLELLEAPAMLEQSQAEFEGQERLRALARTTDALAARAEQLLRADSPSSEGLSALLEQVARTYSSTVSAARPWGLQLPGDDVALAASPSRDLCGRSNELAETAAELLDAWATLHAICPPAPSGADPTKHADSSAMRAPAWASKLFGALTGRVTSQEVIDAIRELAANPDRSLAAAVCIAALPRGTQSLRSALWALIRDAGASAQERWLAFQLYCRLWPVRS